MSEAFEIGVTLALSDGVSESIESTKKEIAGLEQVLHSSGVSMQQLRAAAADILSVPRRPELIHQPSRNSSEAKPIDSESVDAGRAPGSPMQKNADETSWEEAETQETVTRQSSENRLGSPEQPQLSQQGPTAPQIRDELFSPMNAVESERAATPVQPPSGSTSSKAVSISVDTSTSSATLPSAWSLEKPFQNNDFASQPKQFERSKAAQVADFCDSPRLTQRQDVPDLTIKYPVTDDITPTSTFYDALPARQQSSGASYEQLLHSAAPSSQPDGPAASFAGGEDAVADRKQAPVAPMMSSASASPTEGDVFLDGALLGRWMSKHLTQQIGRASAGPTGFDPRRGRLLPGPTVGN